MINNNHRCIWRNCKNVGLYPFQLSPNLKLFYLCDSHKEKIYKLKNKLRIIRIKTGGFDLNE